MLAYQLHQFYHSVDDITSTINATSATLGFGFAEGWPKKDQQISLDFDLVGFHIGNKINNSPYTNPGV
jgi:hypothetical protein